MKRALSIVVVSIILVIAASITALALPPGVPDTTPPVIYGVGISPTDVPEYGCPGNQAVLIQARASDAGGVSGVFMQYKAPGAAAWSTPKAMTLRPDGFWRIWLPRTILDEGAWQIRLYAQDWREPEPNQTYSGIRILTVTDCDDKGPRIGTPTLLPAQIYASHCPGPKMLTVQTVVTDPSGIHRVELWYRAPGSPAFVVVPMTRYIHNAYRATIGPFPAGKGAGYIRAWDKVGNMSRLPESAGSYATYSVDDCLD